MGQEDMGEVLRDMCIKMIVLLEDLRSQGRITEEAFLKQTLLKRQFIEEYDSKYKLISQINQEDQVLTIS